MTAWDTETIDRIAAADDLHIAPYRPDGATPGTPTWIWSVVVDDRLFVRAWNGPAPAGTARPSSSGPASSRPSDAAST